LWCASGQQRRGRSDLLLEIAVVANLLAFLANDGANNGNECCFVAAVGSKKTLGDWEDTEDNFGEGFGQCDGIVEVIYWEGVLAGLDGGVFCGGEDAVGGQDVDLFLLAVCKLLNAQI